MWLGLAEPDAGFDGNDVVRGEKRVVGSFAYSPSDFAEAVRLPRSSTSGGPRRWRWRTPNGPSWSSPGRIDPVKAVIRL